MITPNPIVGVGLHAVGGISASACYLPYHKIQNWSWASFWLVQALFAWILVPLLLGILTVPGFFSILAQAPPDVVLVAFLLGGLYGFGGMSFGLATRQIGYSLTYSLSIGISAVVGTVLPLFLKGSLLEYFSAPGGDVVLAGMMLSLIGVGLCGWAGFRKEAGDRQSDRTGDRQSDRAGDRRSNKAGDPAAAGANRQLSGNRRLSGKTAHFNMRKGGLLCVIAGILSGVFNISLEYGQPIADLAARHGAGNFEGNAKLIVSTSGCFVVNLVWFLVLGIRQNTLTEMSPAGVLSKGRLLRNFTWSGLAGTLWCMQFFFYGLGHVKMGNFQFASWVIHMSMLIFFSYLVGMIMKEWKNVSKNTRTLLILALSVLCASFVLMSYGANMN